MAGNNLRISNLFQDSLNNESYNIYSNTKPELQSLQHSQQFFKKEINIMAGNNSNLFQDCLITNLIIFTQIQNQNCNRYSTPPTIPPTILNQNTSNNLYNNNHFNNIITNNIGNKNFNHNTATISRTTITSTTSLSITSAATISTTTATITISIIPITTTTIWAMTSNISIAIPSIPYYPYYPYYHPQYPSHYHHISDHETIFIKYFLFLFFQLSK
ncbi:hypothetical protein C1645_759301 [Glomus cerebriforme]|uniref:Uncharacterized protein n=1 Tax=Glomus cerebriforme TaxID=658196 RepID=A0A397TIL1_9GLOM|nr:hypothetical protein C1645_759301 [Glomus cerebriforme]